MVAHIHYFQRAIDIVSLAVPSFLLVPDVESVGYLECTSVFTCKNQVTDIVLHLTWLEIRERFKFSVYLFVGAIEARSPASTQLLGYMLKRLLRLLTIREYGKYPRKGEY